MKIDREALQEHVKGEMVAGQLIARIGEKPVVLGVTDENGFRLNEEGLAIARRMAEATIAEVTGKKGKAPKDKAPKAEEPPKAEEAPAVMAAEGGTEGDAAAEPLAAADQADDSAALLKAAQALLVD